MIDRKRRFCYNNDNNSYYQVNDMALRYSRKRELVLDAVRSSCAHPTAEMVYQSLKAEYPDLSLGTVYRNLNLLVENGLLIRLCTPDAADHFDARLDAHQHICCSVCGCIRDVNIDLPHLRERTLQETGFTVERVDVMMSGVCPSCRKQM